MEHAPPIASGRQRFVAEREPVDALRLAASLMEVIAALAAWRPDARLRRFGDPPRTMTPTAGEIVASLDDLELARRRGEPAIWCLASDADGPGLTLFLDIDPLTPSRPARVWFTLPSFPDPSLDLDRMIPMVGGVCRSFDAWQGRAEDESLLMRYRSGRVARRAAAALPPHLREHLPEPLPGDGELAAPPELLLPDEFDDRRVPDAIWWIAYWGAAQVRTVGLDAIRAAGFERVVESPDGGVVIATGGRPLSGDRPDDLRRIGGIIERLGLRRMQERHRAERRR